MKYFRTKWIHNITDEPYLLLSELDENNYEIRKIEIWRNGRVGYASKELTSNSTALGLVPVPPISEINKDNQFQAKIITKEEFEDNWNNVVK